MTKLSEREIILDKENEQVVSRKEWLGEERNSDSYIGKSIQEEVKDEI